MATKLILIRESRKESFIRDAVSFATLCGSVLFGVLIGSYALQWAGALLATLYILSNAARLGGDNKMTIQQARKKLDEWESENADD